MQYPTPFQQKTLWNAATGVSILVLGALLVGLASGFEVGLAFAREAEISRAFLSTSLLRCAASRNCCFEFIGKCL
jgi:hypothetical protein